MHCTASGKLFLAFAHESDRRQLLERLALEPLTPKSITSHERLDAELRHIRAQEISVDDEEFIRGMVAIAVPVKDANGQVLTAIACHAPTAQKTLRELLEHSEAMNAAAQEMAKVFSRR